MKMSKRHYGAALTKQEAVITKHQMELKRIDNLIEHRPESTLMQHYQEQRTSLLDTIAKEQAKLASLQALEVDTI